MNSQDTHYVLGLHDTQLAKARQLYSEFIQECDELDTRQDLTGGGLIRSAGGWAALKTHRENGKWKKGDERILGDSEFVEKVLKEAGEQLYSKTQLQKQGYDLNKIAERVSELLDYSLDDIWNKGKRKQRVKARSLLCY